MKKKAARSKTTATTPKSSLPVLRRGLDDGDEGFIERCAAAKRQGHDLAQLLTRHGGVVACMPKPIRRMVHEQKVERRKIKVEAEVSPAIWGILCSGAAIWGCKDISEMLTLYLAYTVTEWASEDSYFLE